ncbi:MAG: PhoH family protein [Candidatus Omnitrophica bacterium]|nr:PhoH family protein [Candidatus Omnitrophota bacterium]
MMVEKVIKLHNIDESRKLFGNHDENLKFIERKFSVKTIARGENLKLEGEAKNVEKAQHLFHELLSIIRKDGMIKNHELQHLVKSFNCGSLKKHSLSDVYTDKIEVSAKRKYIVPKTKGQKEYIDFIRKYDIVFAIGPAGTGKTYLAMAMAVQALMHQEVSRVILTRPAVEAGESLGFLPGDIYEKVSPYLRPLYDALYDMLEVDKIQRYMDRGIIEVAPLAFMRGRTLNDSFIILDEAQNCTPEQMKMFLTRLGFDSKTVITGDVTQSDLPGGKPTGLLQAEKILKRVKGIRFAYLSGQDVVRHELVQAIIKAYAKISKEKMEEKR